MNRYLETTHHEACLVGIHPNSSPNPPRPPSLPMPAMVYFTVSSLTCEGRCPVKFSNTSTKVGIVGLTIKLTFPEL